MRIEILGFKQEKLIENNISLDEALILRNIEDFIVSGKTMSFFDEADNLVYHWISYQKILDDLPILNISRDRLSKIILRNLVEKPEDIDEKTKNYSERMKKEAARRKYLGFLKFKLIKNPVEGSRTYFALTDKFYEMKSEIFNDYYREGIDTLSGKVSTPSPDKVKTPPYDKVPAPHQARCPHRTKDIYINIYKYIVEYLNEKTGKNYRYNTKKTQSLIRARIRDGFSVDDFKRVIDVKCDSWKEDNKMSRYLRPETLFGPKFESYLNEIPTEIDKIESSGVAGFKSL